MKQLQRRCTGGEALRTARTLMDSLQTGGSSLFANQPLLKERLASFATKKQVYLVQEYNNSYSQLAQHNKLAFICSAQEP